MEFGLVFVPLPFRRFGVRSFIVWAPWNENENESERHVAVKQYQLDE